MSTDDHALIGAWALDAVDPDERDRIEGHLDSCASCTQEADELREAVSRLSDTTRVDPPMRLRAAVLARAHHTRQEAPATRAPEPEGSGARSARSRASRLAQRRRPRPPAIGRRRLRLGLGAVGLAAAAAFGGVFATWSLLPRTAPTEADRVSAVLAAPDAEVAFTDAEGAGSVTVISSAGLDQAVVVVSGLPDAGADHAYQVWAVEGTTPVSAGVMDPGDSSSTMLIDGMSGIEIIAVTREPAGGSATPTLPVVADVPLDA
ncbi:anti-sigma factor domain-containing protein [Glycomyces mayteni]|uniref:anti-sigma factor n=1 Tax=Glycomyces mayteni TaxID=543887 RepID=UPI0035EB2864